MRTLANTTVPEEGFTASASIEVRLSQGTVEVALDRRTAMEADAVKPSSGTVVLARLRTKFS